MQSQAIRYDLLVQDALRGMVRELLAKVAREGLPGEHHFFITFKTHAPGVQLSARMKARYPDEITIVLQHQFWDLNVTERQFEVGLSFSNVPEKLVVPFSALSGFHDPSVPFMLKFEPKDAAAAEEQSTEPTQVLPRSKPESIKHASIRRAAPEPEKAEASKVDAASGDGAKDGAPAEGAAAESEPSKVVSIDAFRKKT
ncbi:MAG: hypothetical protein K2Y29_00030 [Beijerinckiaceae bacterium]|nr:hypothetical protein [Beijerinckiaceae bacterium]